MLLTNKLGYKRSYKHRNKHMPPKANQRHFGQRPWMLEMYATNCSLNIYEDTFCQTSDLLHKPPHYTYFWHSKVSNTKVENRSTHGVETDASAYLSLASCNLLTAKVDCFVLFAPWTTCTNWDQNRFISFSTYHAHKLGNRRTDICEDGQINRQVKKTCLRLPVLKVNTYSQAETYQTLQQGLVPALDVQGHQCTCTVTTKVSGSHCLQN